MTPPNYGKIRQAKGKAGRGGGGGGGDGNVKGEEEEGEEEEEEDEEVEQWVVSRLWQRRSRPQKHRDSSRGTTGIPARAAF